MLVSFTSAVQHGLTHDPSPDENKCIYRKIKKYIYSYQIVPVISGVNLHSNVAISTDMTRQDWGATELHCSVKHVSAGTSAI